MEDENRKAPATKPPPTGPSSNERSSASLPHLNSIEKIKKNPFISEALRRSRNTFEMLKSYSPMFLVTCQALEDAVHCVAEAAAPYVSKFEAPIKSADQTLVKGIEKLEENGPLIQEKSIEIFNHAKDVFQKILFVDELKVAGQQAIKEAVEEANEVLAEKCEEVVCKVDRTSELAETLINYYLPETKPVVEHHEAPVLAADDPLLHTVQIVEGLSKKVTRRALGNLRHQIRQMKAEDIKGYWRSLQDLADSLESSKLNIDDGHNTYEENY